MGEKKEYYKGVESILNSKKWLNDESIFLYMAFLPVTLKQRKV
jgi:hypothetical protein